jgi:hypothetical protein
MFVLRTLFQRIYADFAVVRPEGSKPEASSAAAANDTGGVSFDYHMLAHILTLL